MSSKTRKYATATHPTIEALIHALYRYPSKKKAVERFENIKKHFVLARQQPEATEDDPVALLWIKGYGLTASEIEQGFTGHYAEMRIEQTEKGKFTLTATKIDRPIATHPQKKRASSKHPNWGHPVMRAVKKGKRYDSVEEASAELELLHTEFPDVSIPGQNKLFIIIYEKRPGISRPTHKIILEIKLRPEGGFLIEWRDNTRTPKPTSKQAPGATNISEAETKSPAGYYTSMVALRKNRKKNSGRPATGLKPPTGENT